MATYTIQIEDTFDVSQDRVFALFSDHKRFGDLLGAPVKRIKDSDQADPNGLGSVRKIGFGLLALEETVTGFEPDSLIEYTITSLSPIRNHQGRIRFSETSDGQTRIDYTISFEEIIPFTGALIHSTLEKGLRRGIKRVPELA
ncbi:SRPBCC family protein [Marinobacter changyiensis]|uniref:SRPBCC family protein n=1 Tax=Marinobacter changyiensis TaxID=2604091 RepID=UPI00126469B3|nr:SRPBCC family protein [Marinobacter changyiensis]